MIKLSNAQRKQVRALLGLAHKRGLSAAVEQLETSFRSWRADEIDVFDLDEQIHNYHQGPARKIWSKYSSDSQWELALSAALHNDILTKGDFPKEPWNSIGARLKEIVRGLFES